MFTVYSEDLTHLGGPMGTEYTTSLPEKHFKTLEEAQSFCLKESEGSPMAPKKFILGKYYDCNWIGLQIKKLKFSKS